MNDYHFNKLPFNLGFFFIHTKWTTENIEVYIHETTLNKTFKGRFELEEMEEAAKELEIPFQLFHKECREALTANLGLAAFKYDLNIEQKKFLLIKKDLYTTIQYLDIAIVEDFKSTSKMLQKAIDIINVQHEEILKLQKLKEEIEGSYRETCNAFEGCIEEKNKMERRLLKKFALLLNSKKAKIAELLMEREQNDKQDEDYNNDSESLDEQPSTSDVAGKQLRDKENKSKLREIFTDDDQSSADDDIFQASTEAMILPERILNNNPKRRKTNEHDDIMNTENKSHNE